MPQAFDPENQAWRNEFQELRELLTSEEYAAARRSTQDAHYTSQEVIEGIYQGLDRLGFQGPASILEPSSGIGHFIGLMPERHQNGSQIYAVELDGLSAAIGRYLYPGVNHINKALQSTGFPSGYFDLALGNPPFGNQKVYDSGRPDLDFSIHNYFLAKSIDSLWEGGLAAFVVSRYFMDAVNNPAREFIAGRANLLGAIRLPKTAFKQNALTEVTADIVFFQKTSAPEPDPAWLKTGPLALDEGREIMVNQYFLDHPGQMIGQMAVAHGMFRETADLWPPADFAGFGPEIAKRLQVLAPGLYQPSGEPILTSESPEPEPPENYAHLKEGFFFQASQGQLARRSADILGRPQYELYQPPNQAARERILGQIKIRDALRELINLEQEPETGEPELDLRRRNLNRLYDDFSRRYGFLNAPGNKRAFKEDPEAPLLLSLERNYDPGLSRETARKSGQTPRPASARKADIFKRRVLGPRRRITRVETAKEALLVSMNERGRPDLELMENLSGRPAAELTRELAELIFLNPETSAWDLAARYLSGNVKAKLAQARKETENNPFFVVNVEALMAVQPPDIEPIDIAVQLGSTWVPPEVVGEFAGHLFGPGRRLIDYQPAVGKWLTSLDHWAVDSTLNNIVWGSDKYSGSHLFEDILANKPIRVEKIVGTNEKGKPIKAVDEAESAAANQKADDIRQEFQNWIWADQARREKLARLYNDKFNTHVPPRYDGAHLELPGSSLAIELRPHQKAAIWRAIQEGTLLADHVVGAGYVQQVIMFR